MTGKMLRLLLLNPPSDSMAARDNYYGCSSKAGYYWPPIDLLALSGKLRSGFELSVIDAVAEHLAVEQCLKLIGRFPPDIVIMLVGPVGLRDDLDYAGRIKTVFNSRIFLSGGPVLFRGKEFIKRYPFIEGVILNFADNNLTDHLLNGAKGRNILSRIGGEIRGEENISCSEDFGYNIPAYELFSLKRYRTPLALRKPLTCVMTSFGCPVGCRFCLYGRLPYASRSLDDLFAEFRCLNYLGIKEIMFSDPNFTVNRRRVEAICAGISRYCPGMKWSATAHAATIDRGLLRIMKNAGCHLLEIGVESGSDEILKRYAKRTDREMVEKAFLACRREKIDVLAYFLFGLPGECPQDMRATLDLALRLDPYLASFSVACPYMGTILEEECRRNGWINAEKEEFDSTRCVSIDNGVLPPGEVEKMQEYAYRRFYLRPAKIIDMIFQSLRRSPFDFLYFLWYFISKAAMISLFSKKRAKMLNSQQF